MFVSTFSTFIYFLLKWVQKKESNIYSNATQQCMFKTSQERKKYINVVQSKQIISGRFYLYMLPREYC